MIFQEVTDLKSEKAKQEDDITGGEIAIQKLTEVTLTLLLLLSHSC